MPVYEYLCQSCGLRFDALQRMTDDPLTECTSCHGPVRRVIQPVGIIFKGSGFYATDSRKSATAATPTPEKSDTSSGDTTKPADKTAASTAPAASSTGSSESKPATTAASSSTD